MDFFRSAIKDIFTPLFLWFEKILVFDQMLLFAIRSPRSLQKEKPARRAFLFGPTSVQALLTISEKILSSPVRGKQAT